VRKTGRRERRRVGVLTGSLARRIKRGVKLALPDTREPGKNRPFWWAEFAGIRMSERGFRPRRSCSAHHLQAIEHQGAGRAGDGLGYRSSMDRPDISRTRSGDDYSRCHGGQHRAAQHPGRGHRRPGHEGVLGRRDHLSGRRDPQRACCSSRACEPAEIEAPRIGRPGPAPSRPSVIVTPHSSGPKFRELAGGASPRRPSRYLVKRVCIMDESPNRTVESSESRAFVAADSHLISRPWRVTPTYEPKLSKISKTRPRSPEPEPSNGHKAVKYA
jgi:hypothetical protein